MVALANASERGGSYEERFIVSIEPNRSAPCAKKNIMPEDRNRALLESSKSSDKNKNKKKKRKKATAPPEDTEKPQVVSLPPETLLVSHLHPQTPGPPYGRLPDLRERRSKNLSKDSKSSPNKSSARSRSLEQGDVDELSARAGESLRWEGVLEDPQAEEKRLELYRANRRQRYRSHGEALLKETQYALRHGFPTESKERKTLTKSD